MRDVNSERAKQGRSGKRVLVVLVVGLIFALIVFVGLGFYGGSLPDENIGGVEESGATSAPAAPAATGEQNGVGGAVVSPQDAAPAPPSAPTPAPANAPPAVN